MKQIYTSTFADGYILNDTTISNRIVNTPSVFAKNTLNYVQEMGTLVCKKSHDSARSRLDSYLLIIILKGSGTINCRDRFYPVKAGDLAFIDCNEEYSHRCAENDPWEISWVHFNGPVIKDIYSLFKKRNDSVLIHPSNLSDYISMINELTAVMMQKKSNYELFSSLILTSLYTMLLTGKQLSNMESNTTEKMNLIKEYAEKNFAQKITLDFLSKEFCVSKYYMSREFHLQFGMTFIQYLTFCRINHAKKLLRFTSLSITEIATKCGFDDAAYFNKVFRENEGVTPGKYRTIWSN